MSKNKWPPIPRAPEIADALCQFCSAHFNPYTSPAQWKFFFCSAHCEKQFALVIIKRYGVEAIAKLEREEHP
jgi:hypothetical protein